MVAAVSQQHSMPNFLRVSFGRPRAFLLLEFNLKHLEHGFFGSGYKFILSFAGLW